MRIIVISDTHGDFWALQQIVERHRRDTELFLFLGDGAREWQEIQELYPELSYDSVRGNCDFGVRTKDQGLLSTPWGKILYTHGHRFNVKYGLYDLKETARQNGAVIALYGHTHAAYTEYDDGLYVMNPGSPAQPRGGSKPGYGILDLTDAGIVTNLVEFPKTGR